MTILQSIVLAIVQGIAEFLPISSKGHLNIAQTLMGLTPSLSLDIFLNTATLFSVFFFFRHQVGYFKKNLVAVCLSTLPAIVVTLVFKHRIESVFSNYQLLPFLFLITVSFLFISKFLPPSDKKLTLKKALIIGIFQAVAILPGVSRSGSTIFAGLLVGLSPLEAFNFSFAMLIPASVGALVFDLKDLSSFNFSNPAYHISFVATFFVGLVSLTLLKKLLISRKLWYFGFYVFAVAIVTFVIFR